MWRALHVGTEEDSRLVARCCQEGLNPAVSISWGAFCVFSCSVLFPYSVRCPTYDIQHLDGNFHASRAQSENSMVRLPSRP